jgi:hypothetical protein
MAIRRRGSRSAPGTCPDGTDVAPSAGQAGNPPNAGPAHCARSPIKPPLSQTPQHHRIPPVPLIRRHNGEHDVDIIRVLDGMIDEHSADGPAVLTAPLNVGVGTK